jgi:hypothetical protein
MQKGAKNSTSGCARCLCTPPPPTPTSNLYSSGQCAPGTFDVFSNLLIPFPLSRMFSNLRVMNFMYRRPILCTLCGAVDFWNVLKKGCWGGGGLLVHNEILYIMYLYTLNLSFLNLYHVLYKQLQINIKYTFKLVFLLHVLILKAK